MIDNIKQHKLPAALPTFQAQPDEGQRHSAIERSPIFAGTIKLDPGVLAQYGGVKFSGANDILKSLKQSEKTRFVNSREVITFAEYLGEVFQNPKKYLRNSSQYTVDAIEYFNGEEIHDHDEECEDADGTEEECKTFNDQRVEILGRKVIPFDFASKPWLPDVLADKTGVEGQELPIYALYKILKKNAKKPHPTRMVVLHGPNGTGKTMLIETLFEALEEYSKQPEGAMYRFNWTFKKSVYDDLDIVGGYEMPVSAAKANDRPSWFDDEDESGADDISVIIPANLNTNPIFMLPEQQRIAVLDALEAEGKIDHTFNKDFIIKGRMDSSSKKIYDALLRYYKGDTTKVLKHVQVERLKLSQQSRDGLVIVQEQETRDAQIQAVTADIDWSKLPDAIAEAFRTAGLVRLHGALPDANRGHLMYDDKWKGGAGLDMLRVAEKSKLNLANVEEFLDLTIWATTNDSDIDMLDKGFANWGSLKERIAFIPVGYVRRYEQSANIYRDRLKALFPEEGSRIIGPHVLDAFGLWTTMSYLLPPQKSGYEEVHDDDKKILETAVGKLNKQILHKALLYQGQDLDSYALRSEEVHFKPDEERVLKRYLRQIADEYNMGVGRHKFLFYEGGSGISPRDAWDLLEEAATKNRREDFTLLELFDELEEYVKQGLEYTEERKTIAEKVTEAMKQVRTMGGSAEGFELPKDYQKPEDALTQVKNHMRMRVRYDVQEALGILKPVGDHLGNLRKYLAHMKAAQVQGPVDMDFRDPLVSEKPNEQFMETIEKVIKPAGTSKADFRRKIIQDVGSWASRHQGEDPNSDDNMKIIYHDFIERMIKKDVDDTRETLHNFIEDAEKYFEYQQQGRTVKLSDINQERQHRLQSALRALEESGKGYTERTLPKMLDFAFTRDTGYMTWLKAGLDKKDDDSSKGKKTTHLGF